jgi:hypothetical protein
MPQTKTKKIVNVHTHRAPPSPATLARKRISPQRLEAALTYREGLGMDRPEKTALEPEEGPPRADRGARKQAIDYRVMADRQHLALRTVPKKLLTPAQWAFVQAYVDDADGKRTLAELAQKANISPRTASKWTDPVLSPHITAAIQEQRRIERERYGVTLDGHLRDLQRIRDAALDAGSFAAAVAAEHKRGLAVGNIYIDRKEIRHGSIDSMSREEVEKRLAELEKVYGKAPEPEIIDSETGEIIDRGEYGET